MKHGVFCTILVFSVLMPGLVHAHPETGLLPDAIAEMEYRIVLDITPNDIATRNKLGIVLYRKNKLQEAEKEFAEVLRVAPNDFDAHDGMGLVKFKETKTIEAVAWFQKAIVLNSEDTLVHHSLGLALEQLGRLQEAAASYRKGLEVNERLLHKGVNKGKELERKNTLLAALQNLQVRIKAAKGEP
jgi:tetratricopeptide (TPR) repeat protein